MLLLLLVRSIIIIKQYAQIILNITNNYIPFNL